MLKIPDYSFENIRIERFGQVEIKSEKRVPSGQVLKVQVVLSGESIRQRVADTVVDC